MLTLKSQFGKSENTEPDFDSELSSGFNSNIPDVKNFINK